jgi:hypothetical protein
MTSYEKDEKTQQKFILPEADQARRVTQTKSLIHDTLIGRPTILGSLAKLSTKFPDLSEEDIGAIAKLARFVSDDFATYRVLDRVCGGNL